MKPYNLITTTPYPLRFCAFSAPTYMYRMFPRGVDALCPRLCAHWAFSPWKCCSNLFLADINNFMVLAHQACALLPMCSRTTDAGCPQHGLPSRKCPALSEESVMADGIPPRPPPPWQLYREAQDTARHCREGICGGACMPTTPTCARGRQASVRIPIR